MSRIASTAASSAADLVAAADPAARRPARRPPSRGRAPSRGCGRGAPGSLTRVPPGSVAWTLAGRRGEALATFEQPLRLVPRERSRAIVSGIGVYARPSSRTAREPSYAVAVQEGAHELAADRRVAPRDRAAPAPPSDAGDRRRPRGGRCSTRWGRPRLRAQEPDRVPRVQADAAQQVPLARRGRARPASRCPRCSRPRRRSRRNVSHDRQPPVHQVAAAGAPSRRCGRVPAPTRGSRRRPRRRARGRARTTSRSARYFDSS